MVITDYWLDPPPEPSVGLLKWKAKIEAGWQPNGRLRSMGYYEAAKHYKVYIWEWVNVLAPLMGN